MSAAPTNALRAHLDALRAGGRKALGLFLTNGFPDPAATGPILDACVAGGADFIELGMPFSDPLAEGLPIQRASARALEHGVVMADAFRTAEVFTARHPSVPLVLMGYINPVWQYGLAAFCRDAASAGVSGLILPDLPPEEAGVLEAEAARHHLGLTFLVAPNTTPTRVQAVDAHSTGFVYAVSTPGLTGQAIHAHEAVNAYLARTRARVTRNPLLVGFGIRTGEDAAHLAAHTDGVIVGSALIETAARLWDAPGTDAARLRAVESFVADLHP